MPKPVEQETKNRCFIQDCIDRLKENCHNEFNHLKEWDANDPWPTDAYVAELSQDIASMIRNELSNVAESVIDDFHDGNAQSAIEDAECEEANETVRRTR